MGDLEPDRRQRRRPHLLLWPLAWQEQPPAAEEAEARTLLHELERAVRSVPRSRSW